MNFRYCGNGGDEPPTTTPPPQDSCDNINYKILNSADRSSLFRNESIVYCDQEFRENSDWQGPGWYKFDGPAGTKMSETSIDEQQCATHAPGWLNAAHPTIEEQTIDAQVCFHWVGDTCRWSSDVQVKNCGDYFLYNFPDTPTCSLRYSPMITFILQMTAIVLHNDGPLKKSVPRFVLLDGF